MSKRNKRIGIACLAFLIGMTGMLGNASFGAAAQSAATISSSAEPYAELAAASSAERSPAFPGTGSWIVRWSDEPSPAFEDDSVVLRRIEEMNVVVARPKTGVDPEAWLARWSEAPGVVYLEENGSVQALATKPNDPSFASQAYLKQIGMDVAWDQYKSNTSKIIAVVDTGIDLNHPDLKANLVPGVNLLDPKAKPQDDNGHGTNVAGVAAAVGNNKIGVAGGLWQAKIMPVKALEADGSGDEAKLGEGIKYAVDHGASIIVLSSGLFKYSKFMQDVVDYAESKGVLLVAATGNEGQAVKYPAAYPSVLAVGGVDKDNRVDPRSNYGPEVDIVAPMNVYTTALGGDYAPNEGTSMAAPQAAAAAALVWAKYPHLKPAQIRTLLAQTARDIGASGWDNRSGYGLLRVDQALTQTRKSDIYEPNNTSAEAKQLPIDTIVSASIESSADADWFYVNAPYAGTINLKLTVAENARPNFVVEHYSEGASQMQAYDPTASVMSIPVKKGISMLKISYKGTVSAQIEYRLSPSFGIYRDPFENNDKQYQAFALPARTQTIKGTFHQVNDQDWFVLNVNRTGSLQLTASTDTYRMDLELLVQQMGKTAVTIDRNFDGYAERSEVIDVEPGMYYIRLRNVDYGKDAYPVRGEYTLDVTFTERFTDPNEPNDRSFQATSMTSGSTYEGVAETADDLDWFSFVVSNDSYATLRLHNIPKDRVVSLTLYDQQQKQLTATFNELTATSVELAEPLTRGTYYVRVKSNGSFTHQLYRLTLNVEQLTAGFRDVKGHWAFEAIRRLSGDGIISGYQDYRFRPNDTISRAEAAVILSKALQLPAAKSSPGFSDLKSSHWAYAAIAAVNEAGILNGYPDGTFKMNRAVTRSEMAVMLFHLLNEKADGSANMPFTDVSRTHWARAAIAKLTEGGWLAGFPDDTFRPDQAATRAQFAFVMNEWLDHNG